MRLEVTAVRFLWFLVFATWACATSAPPLLLLELNYWEQTNPLLEKAILEGGTPLAEVYIDNLSGLTRGDQQAWERIAIGAKTALPVYKSVFTELVKIQPPSAGMAGDVHTAYGLAWGERLASLELIVTSWESGSDATFREGLDRMQTALALGRHAEDLRRQFNTHLLSQCEKYRVSRC